MRKNNEFLSIVNSYIIDAPEPSNINYFWNLGSLLGVCLTIQLVSGIFLVMHYSSNINLAFISVQHIMTEVNYGWLVRYIHSNGAGFFFIFVVRHFVFYCICLRHILSVIKNKLPYLDISGNRVSNIACKEKGDFILKLLDINLSDEVLRLKFDYLKTNTQYGQMKPMCHKSKGTLNYHNWIGNEDSIKAGIILWYINYICEGVKGQPIGTSKTIKRNMVSTKGSNFYVGGGPDKTIKKALGKYIFYSGRGPVKSKLKSKGGFRPFSTKTILTKLNNLNTFSKEHPNTMIDINLYDQFILSKDLLYFAYNKLKSKPGMMTPGIKPMTLDGMSEEICDKIISQLSDNSFKFSPAKIIEIPKSNGKTRVLSIGTPIDKLVQEMMKIVLESIYEPLFSNNSHGFRLNKNTHSALRQIFTTFKGCTWWIEGDIKECFNSISHNTLIQILQNKIKDQKFIELIKKLLNAGYIQMNIVKYDIVGIPQGSILSPILSNIYLNELDNYIANIKANLDSKIKNPNYYNRYTKYRSLEYQILMTKKWNDKKKLKKLSKEILNTPRRFKSSVDNKILYVRYADDWIVAVNGSFKQTKDIKLKISTYLKDILNLELSEDKTKITNAYTDYIHFLGTDIKHSHRKDIIRSKGHKKRTSGFLMLNAPIHNIVKQLSLAGFHKNYKGVTRTSWLALSGSQIIHLANNIIRGYLNYYSFVYNRATLVSIIFYLIRDCVLRTLAAKFKIRTRAGVLKKFGKNLKMYDYSNLNNLDLPKNKRVPVLINQLISVSYKLNIWDFKIKDNTKIYSLYSNNVSIANLINLECIICESKYHVEMHHVRMMKDLYKKKSPLDLLMIKNKRKQIPLCRKCHMAYHYGNLVIPKKIIHKFNIKID